MWGLSPYDNNAQINAFKATHGLTHPAAGMQGGAPAAINVVTAGQQFLGYPTWVVICPDKSMYFDVCWPPPSPACFDPYIQNCVNMGLQAGFTVENTEVCQYDAVQFTDQSNGAITSWNWTFEGGNPPTSNIQNPIVTYNTVGVFDVSLEVSDGTNSNTLIMEDYIEVQISPPVMLMPFPDVCLNWPPLELTGGSPAGGVYAGPGVEDGWFYPSIAGLGSHTIQYSYTSVNGCENTEQETILVDPCTGVENINLEGFYIFPNPTNGMIRISAEHSGALSVKVHNILGMKVLHDDIQTEGRFSHSIDISHLNSGIYLISLETQTGSLIQKVHLYK